MTKTLGALLAGWAHTKGLLDIDADITATYGVPSPRPYHVTSRQIMSQALAGEHGPGEAWEYDATGYRWVDRMAQVVNASVGQNASQVWERELARPLGLSKAFSWEDAATDWAGGSAGTCRDYARVGQLLLNEGQWRDAPGGLLVAKDYVQQMHTPQTHYPPYANYSNPCYGLLTWLDTNPASDRGSLEYPGVCQMWPSSGWFPGGSSNVYLASGMFGQETMVIPDHRMVVVTMGFTLDDNPVQRVVYEGVCKIFPADCASGAEIGARIVV